MARHENMRCHCCAPQLRLYSHGPGFQLGGGRTGGGLTAAAQFEEPACRRSRWPASARLCQPASARLRWFGRNLVKKVRFQVTHNMATKAAWDTHVGTRDDSGAGVGAEKNRRGG